MELMNCRFRRQYIGTTIFNLLRYVDDRRGKPVARRPVQASLYPIGGRSAVILRQTMPDVTATLLTQLHRAHLKQRGYGKARHTFERRVGSYTERFNFQGSSWSSTDEKRFYINVGIAFPEYPDDLASSGYFTGNHWACRVESLVDGAPQHWDVSPAADLQLLATQLASLIERASAELSSRAGACRQTYLSWRASRLASSPAGR